MTKECSAYDPTTAGSFCTITSSNIKVIRAGMRVVYASAADLSTGILNSDLVINGPGHNAAFGHVVLDLHTLTGVVRLSGGTGGSPTSVPGRLRSPARPSRTAPGTGRTGSVPRIDGQLGAWAVQRGGHPAFGGGPNLGPKLLGIARDGERSVRLAAAFGLGWWVGPCCRAAAARGVS